MTRELDQGRPSCKYHRLNSTMESEETKQADIPVRVSCPSTTWHSGNHWWPSREQPSPSQACSSFRFSPHFFEMDLHSFIRFSTRPLSLHLQWWKRYEYQYYCLFLSSAMWETKIKREVGGVLPET